ncbi:MAG: cytochrome ubiquinol oxidase subunit I [Archaeoglobaceae archaeon]
MIEGLLALSALGVYFHAIFVSITLGFPLVIMALLWKHNRTGVEDYFRDAKIATSVLAVNFALGAITGTLVEFGLVQAWPGTIVAIATFAFTPLAFELVAFACEIALLVLFIVTLGKIKPMKSFLILAFYWIFAVLSGVLITAVNSWLIVPWGTGIVAKTLYPFMPDFGPLYTDVEKLLALKVLILATGLPMQAILQIPEVSAKFGVLLYDPYVTLLSPYSLSSILHNLFAAFLVGTSIALLGYAIRHYQTGEERYLRGIKVVAPIVFVLFLAQPTMLGHLMGVSVVEYNPTKFAMMENALESYHNPIIALVAYGDPYRKIMGFDDLKSSCELHGDAKLGEIAKSVGLTENEVLLMAKEVGVSVEPRRISAVYDTKLKEICLTDLEKAISRIKAVHLSYYTKIFFGILGFLASVSLFAFLKSSTFSKLLGRFFGNKTLLLLSIAIFLGSAVPSALGWFVREVGRKPWTVYGLLYPEELVTVVEYALTPHFLAFMSFVVLAIALAGIYAMYIVATKELKFLELLRGEKNE